MSSATQAEGSWAVRYLSFRRHGWRLSVRPKPCLHLTSNTGESDRIPALFPGEKLLFCILSYLCGFSESGKGRDAHAQGSLPWSYLGAPVRHCPKYKWGSSLGPGPLLLENLFCNQHILFLSSSSGHSEEGSEKFNLYVSTAIPEEEGNVIVVKVANCPPFCQ